MLEFVYLEECFQEKVFSKHIAAQTHSDGQNSKMFCLGPFKKLDSYSVLNFCCFQAFKSYPFWVIMQFCNSSFPPTYLVPIFSECDHMFSCRIDIDFPFSEAILQIIHHSYFISGWIQEDNS